jgi:uncharacterized repeat protein (TIGR01451 family)
VAVLSVVVSGSSAGKPTGSLSSAVPFVVPHLGEAHLDSHLVQVVRADRSGGQSAAVAAARAQSVGVGEGRLHVILEARPGQTAAASAAVETTGGVVLGEAVGLVDALVSPASLQPLVASDAVALVRLPARPFPEAVDEGVAATGADVWHAAGFDGTGVKVAIIDLGFKGYASASLGTSVTAIDHCGGNLDGATADPHGTAVAEIVHEMAPGASLLLVCIDDEVGLAQAEQDAIAAGAKVINHSVGWFDTSRGDGSGGPGTPDAIVADARAHGILWVNAAGNQATEHWNGTFTPDAAVPDFNDFAPGDVTNDVTIGSGREGCAFLKWDDWPVTSEDFDLALVRASDDIVVATSTDDQSSGPLPPSEELCYTNTGPTQTFGVVITRYSAVGSPRFDLFVEGGSSLQYSTTGGSIVEPASSPNALAVGANCWPGTAVEPFSSRGPTIDGRVTPDLTGPDGVSGSVYGSFTSCTSLGGGFFGTSAAAAHVAGMAALLGQRFPAFGVAGLESALLSRTIGGPGPASPDTADGAGAAFLDGPTQGPPLAFAGIGLVNGDGTGLAPLTTGDGRPAFSPDGTKLAFSSVTRDGNYEIYSMNADGTGLVRLTHDPARDEDPTFSPDGSKIAFASNRSGVWAIWVMNADGSAQTQLTSPSGCFAQDIEPSWSPDGAKIVFIATTDTGGCYLRNEVTTVDAADGSHRLDLTQGSGGAVTDGPRYSPDGKTITFSGEAAGLTPDNVYVVPADGSAAARRLTSAAGGLDPAWSADGSRIVFTRSSELWLLDPAHPMDATHEAPITYGGHGYASPVFRPRGAATLPIVTAGPTVSGTATQGMPLASTVPVAATFSAPALAYAWQRCDATGLACAPIAGAADKTYTTTAADVGHTLRVAATVTDVVGFTTATSAATAVVTQAVPIDTALPAITGTAVPGHTLTLGSDGTWSNTPAFTHQWRRCADDGSGCSDIPGATSTAYTATTADAGDTIRLAVTATNTGGQAYASSLPASSVPGAPTDVVATPAAGQATVAFATPPDGGSPITSFTVTASPGGAMATGAGTELTVTGLTNGTSYTFTVTASNALGSGPASVPSAAVAPTGQSGGGGGHGGGGGGSSSFALALTPAGQTVSAGGTATFTVTVTNTGGGYLHTIQLSDPTAPACAQPSSTDADTLYFMAPNVTVTYSCTLSGISSSLTNTITATADNGAGTILAQTATASVTVPAPSPPTTPPRSTSSTATRAATLTVTSLKTVHLHSKHPALTCTVTVSKPTMLHLTLLDAKGKQLATWTERETAGKHTLTLPLPLKARHAGHDRLHITETGNPTGKTVGVTISA